MSSRELRTMFCWKWQGVEKENESNIGSITGLMFEIVTHRWEVNVMSAALKTMAVIALAVFTGCANVKTLEEKVASLTNQVGTLQSEVDTLKRGTTSNAQAATEAQRTAQAASSKADQALAAAQAADQKINNTNASMDRMFAKAVSK
jgi:FtsZ-binding cell division protein ZapB